MPDLLQDMYLGSRFATKGLKKVSICDKSSSCSLSRKSQPYRKSIGQTTVSMYGNNAIVDRSLPEHQLQSMTRPCPLFFKSVMGSLPFRGMMTSSQLKMS
jgi:hypothetical protein